MAEVSEEEIVLLVALYRRAVEELARNFVGRVTLEEARVFSLVVEATNLLDRLDLRAAAWARRNLVSVYNQARRETIAMLAERGLSLRSPGTAIRFNAVSKRSIEALISDPALGFYTGLRGGTDDIRSRLRLILSQARILKGQQETIDDAIARIGSLRGATAEQVKRTIVRELTTSRAKANQVWKPRAAALGPTHILGNLANLPYVTTPSGRNLRLDRYAEMVIRTKASQAITLAQRNALVEHGQGLVSISRNRAKDDDACNLYVGRAFALTTEAAEEWNVPHVDQLPSGGVPFHPHCTHVEVPFFPEILKQSIVERATTKPPSWALGRPWKEVQKTYEKRGGHAYAERQNPNMAAASDADREPARNPEAVAARQRKKAAMAKKKGVG